MKQLLKVVSGFSRTKSRFAPGFTSA